MNELHLQLQSLILTYTDCIENFNSIYIETVAHSSVDKLLLKLYNYMQESLKGYSAFGLGALGYKKRLF